MRYHPLVQLTLGKLRELFREPEALFWVFVFPVLLALALGIAFRSSGPGTLAVGVEASETADWVLEALKQDAALAPRIVDAETARQHLRTGKLALVVVPAESWVFWYDPTRPDSRLAKLAVNEALQRAAGRVDVKAHATREMTEKGSRYIDFLIPGLLGINLMGTGMWGIGFYIVNARSKHLLKRFVATPMRKSDFLISQITGRLVFLIFEVGVLLVFARYAFDVPLRGSIGALAFLSVLGAVAFCGLGLLVASRARTVEGVSGLMNFVMLPMWIGSGTFFSTARFPDAVQPVIQVLPLTAINDALRAVMLDGARLVDVAGEILIAGLWGAVAFTLALVLFRWT